MANVLCLDFDDTIVLENTARQLWQRFADPRWRDDEAAYQRGETTVEQLNAKVLDRIDVSVTREELEAYVREAAIVRGGFLELLDWAAWNDWQAAVVSNGYDFYVDAVLDSLGVRRVARHCGRTMRQYRWRVKYLSPRGIEVQSGFKMSYATAFRDAGDFVAYIGDGRSDVAPARLAPAVFARDTLWDELEDEHARIYPFETFDDVRAVLEAEAAAWLQSFSSTTAAEA